MADRRMVMAADTAASFEVRPGVVIDVHMDGETGELRAMLHGPHAGVLHVLPRADNSIGLVAVRCSPRNDEVANG